MPGAGGVVAAAPVALTNSTGGTVSNTLAALTVTAPADFAAVGVQFGIQRNALASLAAKINEIRTALINAGIMT
jgi:hypothetical protein